MKISSCSSLSSKRSLFAAVALTLVPFGSVPELIQSKNPWNGFHGEDPLLLVVRAERIAVSDAKACGAWVSALEADSIGTSLDHATTEDWTDAQAAWAPWKDEELKGIETCLRNPCEVKLNADEAKALGVTSVKRRKAKYLDLVLDRVHRYQRTQERKEYEFPGDPVDPWKRFEAAGFKTGLAIPRKLKLEARRIDFFPGKVKAIRQVFDTRFAAAPDRSEGVLWRRDAYSDHYFDGWGEWARVSCEDKSVTVVMAVFLELDLMKNDDWVSKMARPKMRKAAEDNGTRYLSEWFGRLRKRAGG